MHIGGRRRAAARDILHLDRLLVDGCEREGERLEDFGEAGFRMLGNQIVEVQEYFWTRPAPAGVHGHVTFEGQKREDILESRGQEVLSK